MTEQSSDTTKPDSASPFYRVLHRLIEVTPAEIPALGWCLPPLLARQAVHVLGRNQSFSNRKARDLLGWEPRTSLEDGLRETIEWDRTNLASL